MAGEHIGTSIERSSLERLMRPRSIALVGATDRSVWSVSAFDNLVRFEFGGKVHLVNPKGGVIHGKAAATSCAAVGEPIDAALLMVPEAALLDTFEDLQQAGVAGAVVLSAGFAELGAAGAARQAEVALRARAAGIRLIGPNCLGFANFLARTPMWTTPLRRPMPNASLAIVSQSGALASQLEQFAYQQRIALTHMVSTGNEADITICDIIEYLAEQPEVHAIALFLETVRDPAHFTRAVTTARKAGKPLVVLKVGSSEAAAKAAQAHTGSLVGDDGVFNALCGKLGIARVNSLEELIVTADLFSRLRSFDGGGLALIAMSGGLCEIAIDRCEGLGIPLPSLATETLHALRETLPPLVTPSNPLDVTGAAMLQPELLTQSIKTIAGDPAIGMVGFVFDIPAREDKRGMARSYIKHVSDAFTVIDKPALMMSHTATSVSGEARSLADEHKLVYSGGGTQLCLNALAHLFRQQRNRRIVPGAPTSPGVSTARPKSERAVLEHLARHGVQVIPGSIAPSAAAACEAARAFGGPVALKIASPDIPHKTDIGGVALDVSGDAAVRTNYENILARARTALPHANIEGVIVSPMRTGGIELFIGTLRDPQWGPAIAVGLGGVWVEALRDTSLRLLPISDSEALEMLGELRGSALLDGFRGAAAVDRIAVARALVAIGNAALALGSDLVALEVNPLLASADRVEALDALAIWS